MVRKGVVLLARMVKGGMRRLLLLCIVSLSTRALLKLRKVLIFGTFIER